MVLARIQLVLPLLHRSLLGPLPHTLPSLETSRRLPIRDGSVVYVAPRSALGNGRDVCVLEEVG